MTSSAPPNHPAARNRPTLSVVVPMFNEAGNVDQLVARLTAVLDNLLKDWEIVCVDDGSRDETVARLLPHLKREPRLRLVELSRNFGKELALTAGLHHATGRAVVMIDADLQHPPEIIQDMLSKWKDGYEMVIAARRSRDTDSWLRRMHSKWFYRVFSALSDTKIRPDAGDFRLLDRKVVDALNALPEQVRFMKGLYAWVGFKQVIVPYEVQPRHAGASTFNALKLWRFALDGLTSFTDVPLKVWTVIGMFAAVFSLTFGVYELAKALILGVEVPGYPSIFVAVVFFGGVQLITLGIMGEYLGRIFTEVKGRPLYLVRSRHGFGTEDKDESR